MRLDKAYLHGTGTNDLAALMCLDNLLGVVVGGLPKHATATGKEDHDSTIMGKALPDGGAAEKSPATRDGAGTTDNRARATWMGRDRPKTKRLCVSPSLFGIGLTSDVCLHVFQTVLCLPGREMSY